MLQVVAKKTETSGFYRQLSAIKADSLIKANAANPDFVILDVRTAGEYTPDHLEGAINRDYYSNFSASVSQLNKQKIYLLHCASGNRSAGAFSTMKTQEFSEVYELIGGIGAWKSAGLPTTNKFAPKLMIATKGIDNWKEVRVGTTDTLMVRLTNRGNELLQFLSVTNLNHNEFTSDFNLNKQLAGSEDYTFKILFKPGDLEIHSLKYTINSNGGTEGFSINRTESQFTGISLNNLPDLVVYPNPAKERLYVQNLPQEKEIRYSIIDYSGRIIDMGNLFQSSFIDLSSVKPGYYLFRMESDSYMKPVRIQIQ